MRGEKGFVGFLIWASGNSPDEVYEQEEQRHYARIGALLVVMFGWTAFAMSDALAHTQEGHPPAWVYVGGFFWAVVLQIIEQMVQGRPLMKDTFPYRFFQVFLVRGILAVSGAVVTAIVLLTILFNSAITTEVHDQQARLSRHLQADIDKSAVVVRARASIETDNKTLQALNKAVTDAQSAVDTDIANAQCEAAGTCGTGHPDVSGSQIGWATQAWLDKKKQDQAALDAASDALNSQAPDIKKDIKTNEATIHDAEASVREAQAANGLQERGDALLTVLRTHWTAWPWVFVVFALEMFLLLYKAFSKATRLDLAARRRAEDDVASDEAYATSPERELQLKQEVARRIERKDVADKLRHDRAMARLNARRLRDEAARSRSPWWRQPVFRGAVALVILGGAGALWLALTTDTATHPTASSKPHSVSAPAAFTDYQLPPPSGTVGEATKTWLESDGRPLLDLHNAVAATVASYTPATCATARKATEAGEALIALAASAPDETLAELSLDETHAVTLLGSCPASAPSDLQQLAGIDTLFAQRLEQMGIQS